jgi:DNA-binding CsgD family transcriptional regulator
VATLHEATGGYPSRSPRYQHAIVAYGGEQEMIAGLRTASGEVWGALGLYREKGRPLFDADDLDFVRAVAPHLAEGARRALLLEEATHPEGPEAPGLIVVGDDWSVESMTPGVERWLDELPDGDWHEGDLPSSVYAVAGQALRTAAGADAPGEIAFARVLSSAGRWIVLHGAALVSDGSRRAAVIVEPAHPARIIPLLMAAYQLTNRGQAVIRLILQGSSTAQIAASLFISTHTVQQHLKNVFAKTGVRSRRDLVGKIFFSYYEPRVRDNEQRVTQGRPVRGGPLSQTRRRTPADRRQSAATAPLRPSRSRKIVRPSPSAAPTSTPISTIRSVNLGSPTKSAASALITISRRITATIPTFRNGSGRRIFSSMTVRTVCSSSLTMNTSSNPSSTSRIPALSGSCPMPTANT